MSSNNDEAVSQFLSLTGSSDASQAQSYLEMSANDLQTAVDLFLEHQFGGGGGITNTGSNSNGGTGGSHLNNDIYDQDGIRAPDQTRRMRLMDFDDDGDNDPSAALLMRGVGGGNDLAGLLHHPILGPHAAAMMNMDGSGSIGGGGGGQMPPHLSAFADPFVDENGVRLPGRGFGSDGAISNVRDMINASTNNSGVRSVGSGSLNVHIDDDNDDLDNYDDEVQIVGSVGGSGNVGAGIQRLNDLFAAPVHLIHSAGGFQGARNVAKDARRWLLVNLQCDADFACHALNRDVWRDELVENLVREGFIFWQSVNESPDGRTYVQRYNVQSYPHIGIIDPRTARLVFRKEGWTQENPLTAEMFAQLAADFCSQHSFDKPPSIPREMNNANNTVTAGPSAGIENMTEEEQLQAAIRASMNEASGINNDDNDDYMSDNDDYYNDSDDDNDFNDDADNALDTTVDMVDIDEAKEVTFHEEIAAINVGDEPTGDGARIMIRMPDGKRLVRKFNLSDNVKMVYAFVAQSNDDARNGKEFELKAGFPPKNLLPILDNTIESSGLAGDSVTVRWKEE